MKNLLMVTITCFLYLIFLNTTGYAQDTEKSLREADIKQFIGDRIDISNKLESCEVYDKKVKDPVIDNFIHIHIKEAADNKCIYSEKFISNMQIECKFSIEQRKAVADYYRKLMDNYSKKLAKDGLITFESDANNPMSGYMNDGTCSVSLVKN